MKLCKKGDFVLIKGRQLVEDEYCLGWIRCKVLSVYKRRGYSGNAYVAAEIRDPKGKVWTTAIRCLRKARQEL